MPLVLKPKSFLQSIRETQATVGRAGRARLFTPTPRLAKLKVTLMEASNAQQWAILRKGNILALSKGMLAQIKSNPTTIWGWFDKDEMKAWSHIFPLTPESQKLGCLPLADLAWMEWGNPWWIFPSNRPTIAETQILNWRTLSLRLLEQSLSELGQEEEIVEREMLNSEIAAIWCRGNLISKKLVLVCASLPCFNLLIYSSERMLGVLNHAIFCAKVEKVPREALLMMGWRSLSRLEAKTTNDWSSPLSQSPSMNILFWNCRGVLNPQF